MPRSVAEWIGSSPDAAVPDRVRLRIFRNADGVCHISGRQLAPGEKWEVEHVIPLWAGGEHRESNLRPALVAAHKEKTAAEATARARADQAARRHLGLTTRPGRRMPGRGFSPSGEREARRAERRKASHEVKRRPMFKDA